MIITLCGSTRFRSEFEEWNASLTLGGHLVFSLGMFGKQEFDIGKPVENTVITNGQKVTLDLVHLGKIDASHAIVVLAVNGYIGDSTYREMEWAIMRNKTVYLIEEVTSRALPNTWEEFLVPVDELFTE